MVLSRARCRLRLSMLLPHQNDLSFLMEVLERGRQQGGDVEKRFTGFVGSEARNGIEVDHLMGSFYVSY